MINFSQQLRSVSKSNSNIAEIQEIFFFKEWDEVWNFYNSIIANVVQFCSQIKELKAAKGRASKRIVRDQQNSSFSIGSTILFNRFNNTPLLISHTDIIIAIQIPRKPAIMTLIQI